MRDHPWLGGGMKKGVASLPDESVAATRDNVGPGNRVHLGHKHPEELVEPAESSERRGLSDQIPGKRQSQRLSLDRGITANRSVPRMR